MYVFFCCLRLFRVALSKLNLFFVVLHCSKLVQVVKVVLVCLQWFGLFKSFGVFCCFLLCEGCGLVVLGCVKLCFSVVSTFRG